MVYIKRENKKDNNCENFCYMIIAAMVTQYNNENERKKKIIY